MPELTHGAAQDLLAELKRGWEGRLPDVIVDLFAEDADYRESPFTPELKGHNAIRARWNDICARQVNIDFEPERIWVSGPAVLASWHAAYTRRRTAERVRVRGFTTLELNDAGKVWRMRQWPVSRTVGVDETVRREE
ncbi:MAG TPA: nuclear transport factor 2 family protein [Candidatus Limnocylindrales bacterium]